MSRTVVLAAAISLALAACSGKESTPVTDTQPAPTQQPADASANPLLSASTLPFQAPPFDKIKDGDYQPAFEEGMKQQLAEIDARSPTTPSRRPSTTRSRRMERTGATADPRVAQSSSASSGANTNDDAPEGPGRSRARSWPRTSDAIYLERRSCSQRVKTHLRPARRRSASTPEQKRLVERVLPGFRARRRAAVRSRQGHAARAQPGRVHARPPSSHNKLLAATKAGALVVDDKAELAGLSRGATSPRPPRRRRRASSTGKWVLPLQNTTQQPALGVAEEPRRCAQRLFKASDDARRARRRQRHARDHPAPGRSCAREKAKLLGFPNYAAYSARRPDGEDAGDRAQAADRPGAGGDRQGARAKLREMQALIDQQKGGFKLAPWDWQFYAEQVRKAQYDLDEIADQAVLRARRRAAGRRVLRREPAVRPHLQGAQRHPGLPPGRARLRGVRRGRHARWRCSTPTTSSATTRAAAPGWTTFVDQSELTRHQAGGLQRRATSPSPPPASRRC